MLDSGYVEHIQKKLNKSTKEKAYISIKVLCPREDFLNYQLLCQPAKGPALYYFTLFATLGALCPGSSAVR